MHQTRKGQQWYFGMKMHIGVDSRTGLAHSAVVTAANVHDKHPLPDLLHGNEQRVYGDSAYASQKALIEAKAPQARDFTNQRVRKGGEIDEAERSKNRNKSRVRARVEHVFAVVKRLWGFNKVRYRGLGQERHALVRRARAGQHLSRAQTTVCASPSIADPTASQWLAARPQKPRPAAQCASHTRYSTRNSVNSSLPHKVATGWRAAATCSALP